ncbi:MAG: DNA polymerase III subunit delta [Acidimicrobiales bacterium]
MAADRFPVYLVKGDDSSLVAEGVRTLVADLIGEADHSLVVEDLVGDQYDVRAVVDAAQTPPLFGDRRVVVARDLGRFLTADVAPLVAYLADPLSSTSLVLVSGGGQLSRPLVDAVRKAGHIVAAAAPPRRDRSTWLAARLKQAPVHLDARAAAVVAEHLGDDLGRLGALCDMLAAAYGQGARVGVDELGPFLGRAGAVAPWDLTDAIDKGDAATALTVLHRLLGAGGRHPLVITATLHTHFARMLRLDGADIVDEAQAATVLGLTGSTFPAKKALTQARKLGSGSVARAIVLLAEADLALKGAVEWPGELVLEVLVARLCRLAPTTRRPAR